MSELAVAFSPDRSPEFETGLIPFVASRCLPQPIELVQIQIQIESLHTRLDETDEMTNTGVVPAGPFLGARTTRAPRDAGGPPFVLSARAEPRIKGGELQ